MAQANGEHRNPEQPRSVGGILLILFALLGPPAIWITHFNIMYFLVQPICRLGGEGWFHAASVVALVGITGAAVAAWIVGRRYGDGLRAAMDGEGSWKGFVGVYGLGSAFLFGYAVIYTWSPVFTSLGTCTGM